MTSPTLIDFCGDSTMVGSTLQNGAYQPSPFAPPAVVQGLMGSRATCRNLGVGGSTSQDWHLGHGWVPMSWTTRMTATNARILVINTGINDAFTPGLTTESYVATMTELNRLSIVAGKRLVYVTPNPINYYPHINILWALQHAMKSAAPAIGMPVIDVWTITLASIGGAWPGFLPDAIHPGHDLYRLIGNAVYAGLLPLLAQ